MTSSFLSYPVSLPAAKRIHMNTTIETRGASIHSYPFILGFASNPHVNASFERQGIDGRRPFAL